MKPIIVLVGTVLSATSALACTCFFAGPFLEIVGNTKLVAHGVVLSHEEHGLDFQIIGVLSGSEERPVIRVWGDTGILCRTYAGTFPRGTEWVLALHQASYGVPGERSTDYEISVCGEYALEVQHGSVVDNSVVDRPERISLEALRERLVERATSVE